MANGTNTIQDFGTEGSHNFSTIKLDEIFIESNEINLAALRLNTSFVQV